MNKLVVLVFICPFRDRTARTRAFPKVPTRKMMENPKEITADSAFQEEELTEETFIFMLYSVITHTVRLLSNDINARLVETRASFARNISTSRRSDGATGATDTNKTMSSNAGRCISCSEKDRHHYCPIVSTSLFITDSFQKPRTKQNSSLKSSD